MTPALSQGAIAFILLLAGSLTLVAGFILVRLYRRAVDRAMRRRGQAEVEAARAPPVARPPELELRIDEAQSPRDPAPPGPAVALAAGRRFARGAAVYSVAGFAHAAVATLLLFLFAGVEFYLWRTAIVFWAHAWPVVLVLNLFWGPDRRWQVATLLGYFGVLLLLSLPIAMSGAVGPLAVGSLMLPPLLQPLFLWLITAAPGVFLLVFLNRRIRSIGPLLLVMMLIAVIGAHTGFLIMHAEAVQRLLASIAIATGINVLGLFYGVQLLGFALFLVPGWRVAAWLRRRYEAKRTSDQIITFDAIWLLMALLECSGLAWQRGAFGWLGLLAFGAYRLVVIQGMKPLHRDARAQSNARLLLLRVFGAQRRSERLFDLFGARWRYRGSIQLIGGTDLATTTLEPHEFLDFLSGRLAQNFIYDRQGLESRLDALDLRPDPDGRFRVNEFFCDGGAWQMTVARLMGQSDVLLMDLRGFSSRNQGCIFELQALIDSVPIDRLLLLIDGSTEFAALQRTLLELWQNMSAASPNSGPPRAILQLLKIESSVATGVRRLLELCDRVLDSGARVMPAPAPGALHPPPQPVAG
jgi:hypothetical protein